MNDIEFATFISLISHIAGRRLGPMDVRDVKSMLTTALATVKADPLHNMLAAMARGGKIDAIKAYRELTGAPLADANNFVSLAMQKMCYVGASKIQEKMLAALKAPGCCIENADGIEAARDFIVSFDPAEVTY